MSKSKQEEKRNISHRVLAAREALGLTQDELAQRMGGYSRNYISMLERGKAHAGKKFISQLVILERTAFAKNLASGKEEPSRSLRETSPSREGSNISTRLVPMRQIPVLSFAAAGIATEYEELPIDWGHTAGYEGGDDKAFALEVDGDSMEPNFPKGTIITVSPSILPHNGHLVVAKVRGQGVYFKRFHHSGDGKIITLTSYNPAYPPMVMNREHFHWIWRVVRFSGAV